MMRGPSVVNGTTELENSITKEVVITEEQVELLGSVQKGKVIDE